MWERDNNKEGVIFAGFSLDKQCLKCSYNLMNLFRYFVFTPQKFLILCSLDLERSILLVFTMVWNEEIYLPGTEVAISVWFTGCDTDLADVFLLEILNRYLNK